MTEDSVRYPIGKFKFVEPTAHIRQECIRQFRESPQLLREAVSGLDANQLSSTYRDGGWTIAQVVHHLAESDVNAYVRLKYALTVETPTVMVADEAQWAEIPDAKSVSIQASLSLYEAIRLRWAQAWQSLNDKDFSRTWRHADFGVVPVDYLLQQYAWHGRHHTAQIATHRKRMRW